MDTPTTPEEVIAAIRLERLDFRCRVYPHVFLPQCQPSQQWLAAYAVPSWAVTDTFALLDLSRADGRIYVEIVPSVVDRQQMLRVVKLPETADIDILVDLRADPLRADEYVPLESGCTVTFVPRGTARPGPVLLANILERDGPRVAHPIELPAPAGRHLCIVTDEGNRLLSFAEGELLPSPMMLPMLMGFPSGHRICPPRNAPNDVLLNGFYCSAVLVIAESDNTAPEPYICIIDCRGLLQGWMIMSFEKKVFQYPFSTISSKPSCPLTGSFT